LDAHVDALAMFKFTGLAIGFGRQVPGALTWGKRTPDSVGLRGAQRIIPARVDYRAVATDALGPFLPQSKEPTPLLRIEHLKRITSAASPKLPTPLLEKGTRKIARPRSRIQSIPIALHCRGFRGTYSHR